MTLPNERRNAVLNVRMFLLDLSNPRVTKRVPSEVRQTARALLKHYPSEYDMERVRAEAPVVFGEWDSEYEPRESYHDYMLRRLREERGR